MKKWLVAASVLLFAVSGMLYWGSSFASTMIHDQLTDQKIVINEKAALEKAGEKGDILNYAGQTVDTGIEAKIYAEYIKGHLEKVAGGKTYSEVSAEFQKDRTNQALAGQRTTLFMGETLRGLLLITYGWSIIANVALYASIGVLLAGVAMLAFAFMVDKPQPAKASKSAKKSHKK